MTLFSLHGRGTRLQICRKFTRVLIGRCVEAPFVVLTNKGELLFLLCDLDLKRVVVKIATLGFDLDRNAVPLA